MARKMRLTEVVVFQEMLAEEAHRNTAEIEAYYLRAKGGLAESVSFRIDDSNIVVLSEKSFGKNQ